MADDLLGARLDRVKSYAAKYAKPRKSTWTPAAQVAERVAQKAGVALSPETTEKIRVQRAERYYHWATEELQRWRGRLPEDEWLKLKAHVNSLKP